MKNLFNRNGEVSTYHIEWARTPGLWNRADVQATCRELAKQAVIGKFAPVAIRCFRFNWN